ncbi:hypothetical protein BP5796_09172 [Coleophoma crateriformis]|uniref:Enoyl reductase (ER) domain-containing protein n=1 Tax=Coleophoma crateriformis TaxID=565419 RepID=A0A3D8R389_9HELO|nr:hypothetical protein BP5796_09172 [Coleophoma crateriformis]
MRGVTVASPGAPYEVADDLPKPSPNENQVLVKSLFSGINPVETFMQSSGMMVTGWPVVLGCDASGEVVEVGKGVSKFKIGDHIYGCTRLGVPGYGTFQEYHLMDEKLAFKKPSNVSVEQAATLGVGLLVSFPSSLFFPNHTSKVFLDADAKSSFKTASLGLIAGLGIEYPVAGETSKRDEWLIILGGSGSVGQYATQIASLSGYQVLASCSPSKAQLCTAAGASATFDYKLPLEEQVSTIKSITGGNFIKVFDAGAASYAPAMEMLVKCSNGKKDGAKHFASTDDWSPMSAPERSSINIYRIRLGQIGRYGEGSEQEETCRVLEEAIVPLERLVADGKIKPMEWEIIGHGFKDVASAVKLFDSGKLGGKKALVKVA